MFEPFLAFSQHISIEGDWNEIHPGFYYHFHEPLFGVVYLNSEDSLSVGLGARFEGEFLDLPVGLEVGGVTGYSGGVVVPFLKADIEVLNNTKLFITPAVNTDYDIGIVVGVQIGF